MATPTMSINNTNSDHLGGHGRSTSEGLTVHERSDNVYQRTEYLSKPRIPTIPLPLVHDTPTVTTVRSGDTQTLPSDLLIYADGQILSTDLEHSEIPRAVVSPMVSDMPQYAGHMWGAANERVDGAMNGRRIHFVDSMVAATNPPQTRLRIMTTCGGTLVVDPRAGNMHVTVGDVQRAVIGWMRPIEQDQGQRAKLTKRMVVCESDGTRMEVEIWVWKGLRQVGDRIDLWAIQM